MQEKKARATRCEEGRDVSCGRRISVDMLEVPEFVWIRMRSIVLLGNELENQGLTFLHWSIALPPRYPNWSE